MNLERKIFVIMPFSKTTDSHTTEYWTNHYEHFLKSFIQQVSDYPVERSKAMRKDILKDIIKNLIFSQIVICDITDLNANVLWELGVRQSFTKGTVIISEEGTQIPFDISIKGIISYPKLTTTPNYHRDMNKFKDELRTAITDCITHPEISDSHVLETISGRGTIYEIIFHEEIIRKLDALIADISLNNDLFSYILETRDQNRQRRGNKDHPDHQIMEWVSNRMRSKSVELLLTTRYLNQNVEFYTILDHYLTGIQGINSQLDLWPQRYDSTERYIDKIEKTFNKDAVKMLQKIRDIRFFLSEQL